LFSEEKAGIATGPMWGTAGLTVDVEKARPGADVAVMPLPTGPTGERGRKATKQMYHVWVFRRGLEDIKVEALLNQLNYYVEYHTNGPEKYECYGPLPGTDDLFLKGYDWDWDANCNVKRLQWNTGQEFRDAGFWHATYIDYQRVINEAVRTFSKMDPTKRNKPQKYFTADPGTLRAIDAYQTLFDEEQYEIGDQYFGVPTARMRELLPVLDKLELEYYTTIITGNKPLGAFDEFVSEWRKRGGDQVTADINAWYASRSK